jgi:8-oxo-dGTP diphosphatase
VTELHEGAAAAVLDAGGRVLLVEENYDRRRWGFPGGAVEPGESPLDAVVRVS